MSSYSEIERRIARLEGCEAIRNLVATYAVGADQQNNPDILGPLFHEDAVWEATGVGRYEGRDRIVSRLAEVGQTLITWSLHYMISPQIEMSKDANSATCRWYLWELCSMADDGSDPTDTWLGGWYDSHASARKGHWAFDFVKLDMRLVSPRERPWTGKS